MTRAPFGTTAAGTGIERLTIGDGALTASILTLGAILQDVRLAGTPYGLTLGSADPAAYLGPMALFGAIVGPVANRITGASAVLDGQRHHFDPNEGSSCLHSGWSGTHALIWDVTEQGVARVTLRLFLPDGLGGFPGNRTIHATYAIRGNATLELSLSAVTDRPTWINLANHSYWNLDGSGRIDGHDLCVDAENYLKVDDTRLPTAPAAVAGSPYDFRQSRPIGAAQPCDHNFCLGEKHPDPRRVAVLRGRAGVSMALSTTEPGLQVYDGAGLKTAPFVGHQGVAYGPRAGIALEPQGWPDAPNRPDFPDIRLDPGATYAQVTRWCFASAEES